MMAKIVQTQVKLFKLKERKQFNEEGSKFKECKDKIFEDPGEKEEEKEKT